MYWTSSTRLNCVYEFPAIKSRSLPAGYVTMLQLSVSEKIILIHATQLNEDSALLSYLIVLLWEAKSNLSILKFKTDV